MCKKILCSLLFVFIISSLICSFSQASEGEFDALYEKGKNVLNPDVSSDTFNDSLGLIVRIIQYTGSGIALIVITIYGIKYMIASPAEKADVKKQIFPILIGCILLFGTVNLVSIVATLAKDAFGG